MLGIPRAWKNDNVVVLSLVEKILRNNRVLKCLRLEEPETPPTILIDSRMTANDNDHSRRPSSMITLIERSLEENYNLEELQVGQLTRRSLRIDHLLRLNRAGRRYLRQVAHDHSGLKNNNNDDPVDWATVLGRASSCPDVLFWLLQNGVNKIIG